jgi:hypothetical protein
MSNPNQPMYIKWNLETGRITQISGQEIPDSIVVPLKDIEKVVLDQEDINKYCVKYNTNEKKYELVNNSEHKVVTSNIADKLYVINHSIVKSQDLTITQDIKNNQWIFSLSKEQPLDKSLWFAATQKDNPNILIRSFLVNLLSLTKEDAVFDFINAEAESSKDVSIFTSRTFDNYEFIQVGYESN